MHIDLHETTDTDNSEFTPALAAREGIVIDKWTIPDGFYLVVNKNKPYYDFQKYIIDAVSKVTPIVPTDLDTNILGDDTIKYGIMSCDSDKEKLCMSFTSAEYTILQQQKFILITHNELTRVYSCSSRDDSCRKK